MAESAGRVDVRMLVVTWPQDAPRGAVAGFCREHGVSRAWFYKVRGRVRDDGAVEAMRPRRPVPRSQPSRVAISVQELAVLARKELSDGGWDCGPISVHDALARMGVSPAPSRATLARLFLERGLVTPQPHKRPRSSWRRFSYGAPNECWQLDGTVVRLRDGADAWVLQVQDDHSRKILGSRAAPAETSEDCQAVTDLAIDRYGLPQRFLTDNGVALNPSRRGYEGALSRSLQARGVATIASSPNHPQTCGKNERLHLTLKRWLAARPVPADLPELQAQLEEFEHAYNTLRPHQAHPLRITPEQAYNATPVAAPPQPPNLRIPGLGHPSAVPPLSGALRRRAQTLTATQQLTTVSSHGQACVHNYVIHVGSEHIGRRLIAQIDRDVITLFDPTTGELLRTVTVEAGRRYYGSGRPRGGTRRPRLLSTPS